MSTITTTPAIPARTTGKKMKVALWVAQILLAAVYAMAGSMKTFTPMADLIKSMPPMAGMPEALVRFIGISELCGAVGMFLTAAGGIVAKLTPVAAVGLALIQALAIPFHIQHGEYGSLPLNVVLLAMAAFVAWGRFREKSA